MCSPLGTVVTGSPLSTVGLRVTFRVLVYLYKLE